MPADGAPARVRGRRATRRSGRRTTWVPEIELGVDSDSPTGARRLYEGVGMRTAYAFEVWEKDLR